MTVHACAAAQVSLRDVDAACGAGVVALSDDKGTVGGGTVNLDGSGGGTLRIENARERNASLRCVNVMGRMQPTQLPQQCSGCAAAPTPACACKSAKAGVLVECCS